MNKKLKQVVRIKLKCTDHKLLDKAALEIAKKAQRAGAVIKGPIPLPVRSSLYTVLRSPHIDKKAMDQFTCKTHKRFIDVYNATEKALDALVNLEISSGVSATISVKKISS